MKKTGIRMPQQCGLKIYTKFTLNVQRNNQLGLQKLMRTLEEARRTHLSLYSIIWRAHSTGTFLPLGKYSLYTSKIQEA